MFYKTIQGEIWLYGLAENLQKHKNYYINDFIMFLGVGRGKFVKVSKFQNFPLT